jgi:general stress protein YciG
MAGMIFLCRLLNKPDMKWLRNNSLSLVFLLLFLFSLLGQVLTGHNEHNQEMQEKGGQQVTLSQYLTSGHFLQATFENWESEFFQMALFVFFTIFLYQRGSSESKDPDEKEEVDREPDAGKKDAPWPVKTGGIVLSLYKNSLSYVLFALFVASFLLHWFGSLKDYNEERLLKGLPTETAMQYLGNTRFWFESFQNWQSEFLSILAMVVLTIFLRQKGSPQSKPVDAPNSETGE